MVHSLLSHQSNLGTVDEVRCAKPFNVTGTVQTHGAMTQCSRIQRPPRNACIAPLIPLHTFINACESRSQRGTRTATDRRARHLRPSLDMQTPAVQELDLEGGISRGWASTADHQYPPAALLPGFHFSVWCWHHWPSRPGPEDRAGSRPRQCAMRWSKNSPAATIFRNRPCRTASACD